MFKRHPLQALLFVWTCDLFGLAIAVGAFLSLPRTQASDWGDFLLWSLILCAAHVGGIKFVGLEVLAGWYAAADFAAAMILPFPLFCLALVLRFSVMVAIRIRKKHPEPLLGPDFNTSNVIMNAAAGLWVHQWLAGRLGHSDLAGTVALLSAALVFIGLQILLTSTLLSLDQRRPWHKVGSLDKDALISDGIMVTAGALVGYIYDSNPYLMLIAILLLLFLHKTLSRINEAKLAFVDAKTGIYNYRYFDSALSETFRKAEQTRRPLALVFGDMDHLRDINNTYGHMTGDQAIAAVARVFRDKAGSQGVACRFGGEEFVLILPGYTKAQAAEVAEVVRQAVAASTVTPESGEAVALSISLGVASYPEDVTSMDELVKAADEATYEAKRSGRNRVCVHRKRKLALYQ